MLVHTIVRAGWPVVRDGFNGCWCWWYDVANRQMRADSFSGLVMCLCPTEGGASYHLVCVEGAHLREVGVFPALLATNAYVVYKNLLARGMRSHGTRASGKWDIKLKSDMLRRDLRRG